MTITAQKYTFHCRFTSEARLPGYLGSTLRGSLGWSLKRVSCALRRQQCDTCLLREQCAYAWIFETERYQAGDGRSVNARPHPFVLQTEEETGGNKKAGDTLQFTLLLIGHGNDLLPQVVYSVINMGESGIGSGRRQGIGRFRLESITAGEHRLYADTERILQTPPALQEIKLDSGTIKDADAVQVRLHTPLRLKLNNGLQRDLPFHLLIRAGLRRIAALEDAYGKGEPDLDYRGLVDRAQQIEIQETQLRWRELFRWSNRQKKKVSLAGLGGSIIYRGPLREFLPILTYCRQVNIGKQTAFGLGRISVHLPKKGVKNG
uniref:CRISPR system precrRNA processing endoribonuclease RAMP protein Cas6 n=1 Tax=Candidatus Electrothrix sp. TaxID=2170559 RepID=UPI004056C24B